MDHIQEFRKPFQVGRQSFHDQSIQHQPSTCLPIHETDMKSSTTSSKSCQRCCKSTLNAPCRCDVCPQCHMATLELSCPCELAEKYCKRCHLYWCFFKDHVNPTKWSTYSMSQQGNQFVEWARMKTFESSLL